MSESKMYEKFNMLEQNRNLNRNHINKIKNSIQKHGYLTSNPIIVDSDMNIIDGQHRFVACQEMGLPINYEVIDDSENMIIDLNTTQRKWSINDYIKYYAVKDKNPNYERVLTLIKKYKTSVETILLIGLGKSSSGGLSDIIKSGQLKFGIDNILRVDEQFKNISSIAKNAKLKPTGRLIKGLIEISKLSKFKWNKMIDQSIKYPTVAYNCRTAVEYAVMLKELYNYNIKKIENKI